MPTALITGTNRGIGLEFVRQYAADGWTVIAGVRDPDKADALDDVAGDVSVASLDVADPASVGILAARLEGVGIDLLINNAGVMGPRPVALGSLDYGAWQQVMAVNALAPMRVAEAFLPHLRAGSGRRIATVSSRMGSIGDNSSGGSYIYRSSKAAVNAAMKSLALDLAGEDIAVVILHPGWVRTDMGGPNASVAIPDSVTGMRRVIDGLTPATTGRFVNYDGSAIPW
ncbi:MAG: SDR family oxidoreductase [Inquilinaceae bacterium]